MGARQSVICRLCLKVPRDSFILIDETAREMLDVLFVKMNFNVSDDPLICGDCVAIVRRLVSFKMMYLESEKLVTSFYTDRHAPNAYAYNLRDIIDGHAKVCRFCLKKVEKSNYVFIDVLINQNTFSCLLKMFMCELDLKLVKNPLTCLDCVDNMQSYSKFLVNCHEIEEKIKEYQQNHVANGQNIMHVNVFETFSKYPKEELSNSLMEIKKEVDTEFEGVTDPVLYQNGEINDLEPCTCDTKDSSHCFRCYAMLIETAPPVENIKVETIPSEVSSSRDTKIETNESVIKEKNLKMYQCNSCEYQTKHKTHPSRHMLVHKDSSEGQLYLCDRCGFKTTSWGNLKSHQLTHKDFSETQLYECDSCDYKTKHKHSLKKHMLVHKDSSEVQIHSCHICGYKSKRKTNIASHLLIHKDASEVRMYQCDLCEYQAKHRNSLNRHMLVHRDSSEVQIYQCGSCEFNTKYKNNLVSHSLVHKDSSDVQMYQCDRCEYQTKRKEHLKTHMLIHKVRSEVKIFQCDRCEYQGKRKDHLKSHMLIHKDQSEVHLYHCSYCEYKTKRKSNLKNHLLKTHKYSKTDVSL